MNAIKNNVKLGTIELVKPFNQFNLVESTLLRALVHLKLESYYACKVITLIEEFPYLATINHDFVKIEKVYVPTAIEITNFKSEFYVPGLYLQKILDMADRKIDAIRFIRQCSCCSLVDGKNLFELIMESKPLMVIAHETYYYNLYP